MPATILMTAHGSEEIASTSIKIGLDDYIVKGRMNDDQLLETIHECVSKKRQEQEKIATFTNKSIIFNKSGFIKKLQLITKEKDTKNNLLLINPVAYQEIGEGKGIDHQDSYIKCIVDCVYDYITSNDLTTNIFTFREEFIAVLIETDMCEKHVNTICEQLENESYTAGTNTYSCSVNAGVISPHHFEEGEFDKTDYELLSIALALCESAKSDKEKKICHYGEINLKQVELASSTQHADNMEEKLDIVKTIADGRISANYQPWIYILSDDKADVKNIYDVRVELIDIQGNKISQQQLLQVMNDAFAKRTVDRWVLTHTIKQLKSFTKKDEEQVSIKLTIKITLSTISDPKFISWLRDILTDINLPKGCLLFEIEALHFIRDTEHCENLIEEIRSEFDVEFILSSITEVATYYHIRETQIFNFVKLDIKDLTFGLPREPLRSLITKIHNDGAKIVAVNVEDAETLVFATEFQVDYVHGYLVGKPYVDVISDGAGDLYYIA